MQQSKLKRTFQKLPLLLLALYSLQTVQAAKKKLNTYFPRGLGIVVNEPLDSFDEQIKQNDQLMFVYVYDSTQERSQQMTTQIIVPAIEELKGYAKWYAFDCQEAEVKDSKRFTMCDKEEYTPFFQLLKPAEMKINPYTKQAMAPSTIGFNDNEVTLKKVQNFILNNLPDFSQSLDTPAKLQDFLVAKDDQDINRVLLVSKKQKTPAIYKALTSKYRDRIRFAFVSNEKNAEVVSSMQLTDKDLPWLNVYQSYDSETYTTLKEVQQTKYSKKDYKFEELVEFLEPFSRETKKELVTKEEEKKQEQSSSSSSSSTKKQKKPYAELYNDRHFNTHILDNEKASLVFFIQSQNVSAEVPLFDKLLKQVLGPLQVGVFYVNESLPANELTEFKKKYKLGNKFPQMRFYKNTILGEEKNQKSFEIYVSNKIDAIMEEIHENIDHDVKEVSEKILNNLAISHAVEEKRNVLIYFYNQGLVSLHYKALAGLNFLKDDFVFFSVPDPSQTLLEGFQIKNLPGIGGILAATGDDENVRQFTYGGQVNYDEILQNLLKLSGKEDEFYQSQKAKKAQSQRKFEEITNQYKFQENCLDKQKGCAIAFLPGNQILDYEIQNHKEHIATLEQLEKEAKTLPLYYMWINATCHNYLLEQFDVNPMFVPTVIFYLPSKDKSAHLIGKFDKETIQKHEQKFVNGKLATFAMRTKSTDIQIRDLDCPNLQPEIVADDQSKDLEDEILQEILREEEERRKQQKQEEDFRKRSSKKKKKKNANASKKDDL